MMMRLSSKFGAASSLKYQRGVIFLLMIVMFVLSITTVAVNWVSINKLNTEKSNKTLKKMRWAQEAVLGHALSHRIPGTLPCPDATGNGEADPVVGGCSVVSGWLPHRTLGLDRLSDGSGTGLWYAVDPNYTTSTIPFNSSSRSRITFSTIESAFVIIAANPVLGSQVRNNANSDRANYFEGINADANVFDFSYRRDDDHNDQLLAYSSREFWQLIEERRVLPEAIAALLDYRQSCGALPWAAVFHDAGLSSVVGLQEGSLPIANALVSEGAACPEALVVASWLSDHWASQLLYRFCLNSQGQCLSINGDLIQNSAAIVISPGSGLVGQNRVTSVLSHFFESDNQDMDDQYVFLRKENHGEGFNDVLQFLP